MAPEPARPEILVRRLRPEAVLPTYAKDGDAGADLSAVEGVTLAPGERIEMPLTFFVSPDMVDDRDAGHIRDITLSYTFFRQDAQKSASAEVDAAPATALN